MISTGAPKKLDVKVPKSFRSSRDARSAESTFTKIFISILSMKKNIEDGTAEMADKTYQVVIWGGTGFVGKLVAEHIARDYAVMPVLKHLFTEYARSVFHGCGHVLSLVERGFVGSDSSSNEVVDDSNLEYTD